MATWETKTCDACRGLGTVFPSGTCPICGGLGTLQGPGEPELIRPEDLIHRDRSRADGGGQYRLLPFMQRLSDSLPGWVNAVVAIAGGALFMVVGPAMYPSTDIAGWIFGILGLFVGFVLLPLTVLLIDFSMQLMLFLVKAAIVAAIVVGVGYGLLQLILNK